MSVVSIVAQVTRLEDRPVLFGAFGAVFAFASVVGPLLGGAFTDHLSWRWCFYSAPIFPAVGVPVLTCVELAVNLPIGAVAMALVMFILEARPPIAGDTGGRRMIFRVDWLGVALNLGMTTTLLLPLQWGGVVHPWSSPTASISSRFSCVPMLNERVGLRAIPRLRCAGARIRRLGISPRHLRHFAAVRV